MKALLLIAISLAVYGFSFPNGFVLDDTQQVINNELTLSLDRLGYVFGGASYQQSGSLKSYGVYYRPIMISSFALIRSMFGLNASAFHIFQWLVHTGVGLLLFAIFLRLLDSKRAFFVASFFLVHPMNTESVVYVAAVQEPLFAIFGFLAFWLYLQSDRLGALRLFGIGFLFLISLLSKETGFLILSVTLVYGFLQRPADRRKLFAMMLAVVAGYLALRAGVAGLLETDHSSSQISRADFWERLPTVPVVVALYLLKFIMPFDLSTNQDWIYREFFQPTPLLSLLGVFSLLLFVVWRIRKSSSPWLGWFLLVWVTLGLGLHSQLLNPLDGTFAERWAYFPLAGFLGLIVWLLSPFWSRWIQAGLTVVLIAFGVKAHQRSLDWKDDFTLASVDIVTDPESPFTQNNFGVELYRRGEFTRARGHLEKAVQLNPLWNVSWNNLGATQLMLGDLQGARNSLEKSLDLGPSLLALRNYPIALARLGRVDEAREFLENRALKYYPQDTLLHQIREELRSGGPR